MSAKCRSIETGVGDGATGSRHSTSKKWAAPTTSLARQSMQHCASPCSRKGERPSPPASGAHVTPRKETTKLFSPPLLAECANALPIVVRPCKMTKSARMPATIGRAGRAVRRRPSICLSLSLVVILSAPTTFLFPSRPASRSARPGADCKKERSCEPHANMGDQKTHPLWRNRHSSAEPLLLRFSASFAKVVCFAINRERAGLRGIRAETLNAEHTGSGAHANSVG
jgi:hypothetical protein